MAVFSDIGLAQFENINELRTYPFADGSSRIDRIGRELPRDIVVDVHLVVPGDLQQTQSGISLNTLPTVKLTSVHISPVMLSVCFTSEYNNIKRALSATVAKSSFSPYMPVRLEKLIGSEDIGGVVTFGDITFPGVPETYFLDSATIHNGCISVTRPAPLRKFIDPRTGESVSGNVEIVFSGSVVAKRDGNAFTLSLEDGADVELASSCAEVTTENACGATPIRSINGIHPDEYGNIALWFH